MAQKSRPDLGNPVIVMGIDFGTTFSGVAWSRSGQPDQMNIITNWKTHLYGTGDKNKAPTTISYDVNAESPSWGYNVPSNQNRLKWFKLLLIEDKDLPSNLRHSLFFASAKASLKKANKHPVEVVGDYLRELWKHSLENIEKDLGKRLMNMSKFKVVVTLPAIWPTYAQIRMRLAVEQAGILDSRPAGDTVLGFISEPEAAALATMEDMAGRSDIKKNDHFVICDAGGGTVDLITYRVVKPTPATVRESVQGDGKLCGAVFLDMAFLGLLRKALPREVWDRLGEKGVQTIMHNNWEQGIKTQFCNDATAWQTPVPYGGTRESGFHSPEITFDQKKILSIYQPVAGEIAELVCKQIDAVTKTFGKAPKYVVLVGGFGKSPYLYQHLQQMVEDKYNKVTEVLQGNGERPWTAVCRGAVIRGLSQSKLNKTVIDSRVARASYGTTCNIVPWDPSEHLVRDKAWCPILQDFLAVDQTKWFLDINEDVLDDEPISHTFFQDLEHPEEKILTELVYSKAAKPPSSCDETVKNLCTIVWSKVPNFTGLPIWKNAKGNEFRQICYDIKMFTDGVSLDFEISHDGEIVASKNVAVDFRESGNSSRPGQ